MAKDPKEWMRQARYDMRTAEDLLRARRYTYAVSFCHLSLEKALKGIFQKEKRVVPPKTHSLLFFIQSLGLVLPEDLLQHVSRLNRLSVVTRYPEDLREMQQQLGRARTSEFLQKSKEVLKWCVRRLSEP
jgi:HEPN domain-containing protein